MQKMKKFLSMLLAIVMIVGMVPLNVFATDSDGETPVIETQVDETVPVFNRYDDDLKWAFVARVWIDEGNYGVWLKDANVTIGAVEKIDGKYVCTITIDKEAFKDDIIRKNPSNSEHTHDFDVLEDNTITATWDAEKAKWEWKEKEYKIPCVLSFDSSLYANKVIATVKTDTMVEPAEITLKDAEINPGEIKYFESDRVTQGHYYRDIIINSIKNDVENEILANCGDTVHGHTKKQSSENGTVHAVWRNDWKAWELQTPYQYTYYCNEPQPEPEVKNYVAQVGDTQYESLKEAVEVGGNIVLLADVTLGEKLTISKDVTISGEYTITRADAYTGTLFVVSSGATLTLDGGLTIDGGNEWVMDKETYQEDLEANARVAKEDSAKWFTIEEGAPVATAYMITTTGGTVNLNDVTIQNNYSVNSGVVSAGANSTITLTGAKITNVAVTQNSGVVANVSGANINVVVNEGTVIDGNHAGGNHGIFKIYSGAVLTMNGGEIKNTTGCNSNGVAVGVYWGTFNMNGGTICSNSSVGGSDNSRCAAIYCHSGHQFHMTGGTICHNSGNYGGVDAPHTNGSATITGGQILNNVAAASGKTYDVATGGSMEISGGTYTQDVFDWLAPNLGLIYNEENNHYTVTDRLYEYNGNYYVTLNSVVEDIKKASTDETPVVKVLYSHKIRETAIVDADMILDLNGKKILATSAISSSPVIRVLADVTVTDTSENAKGRIDGRPGDSCYAFIVGNSTTDGNLTIENGIFYGDTSAVSVTKGKLTINGGSFAVNPYEGSYQYLLNCIDENVKNGTASIEVKGGTFYMFNPADNEAENPKVNFVADGYVSEELKENYWTVRQLNYVAQVGETKYESLKEALEACTNGETAKLIADITYDADDIVFAHGGATGFGNYDQYNPSIIYIGGTKGATAEQNQPSNVNAVLDLNGHTITNNADAYLFLIMDNAQLTMKDSVGTGSVITNAAAPVLWVTGAETLVTIESGKYQTASATGLLHSTHSGDLVITGGEFSTTAEDASLLIMLDTQKFNNPNYFLKGVATVTISGGTFYGFDPEKVGDDYKATSIADIKFVNGCAEGLYSIEVKENVWTVGSYAKWVKAELLAGRSVTLVRDVIIDDYDLVTALKLPSNGNGKYGLPDGNGAVFHVIKPGVVLDLNGYDIVWNAHDADYCDNRQVSLFMVTVTGNPGETADLTITDSVGTGSVDVYGMGSGMYVVCDGATGTIEGGKWTNYPCETCAASNIFLYPSHGGTMEIEGGTFEQMDSNYLLAWFGSSKETTNNGVGVDYDETELTITGGTYIGFNPEKDTWFIDVANGAMSSSNACAEGYFAMDNGDNSWTVTNKRITEVTITIGDATMVAGNALPEFTYTSDVEVEGLEIEFAVTDENKITATVAEMDGYEFTVVPGTLTVKKAIAQIVGGENYASLADAVKAVPKNTEKTIKLLDNHSTSNVMVGHSVPQQITIDLNGYTLSGSGTTLTAYRSGTVLTLTNGTVYGNSNSGGTLAASNNGVLVLGDNLNVTCGPHATAIKVGDGTLKVASESAVVTGGKRCMVVAASAKAVNISAGKFSGTIDVDANATAKMQLSGGLYTVRPEDAWCVAPGGPVPNNDGSIYTWTIGHGIVTVDGVWYSVWEDAKAAIKGDSVIVLYADIDNRQSATNDGKFSFGAQNKTLTLDLNGHSFTTSWIGKQHHETLHITDSAEGGSVTVTNYVGLYANGYLNVDSDVDFNAYLQINFQAYQNTGSTGCFMVDGVKVFGRGHFQQDDGIFGTTGGYVTVKGGLENITINSGKFTLNEDVELGNVTISKDATVDLNGNDLTAKNIVVFGNLIDSQDGVGSVTASGEYYYTNHSNGDYLPLYDSTTRCYRLYATRVVVRGAKMTSDDTLKVGYTVYFNQAEAYKLLAEMAESNECGLNVSWWDGERAFQYAFSDGLVKQFAEAAYEQMKNGAAMTTKSVSLNVNGMSTLNAGDVVKNVPTVSSTNGVVISGDAYEFTK